MKMVTYQANSLVSQTCNAHTDIEWELIQTAPVAWQNKKLYNVAYISTYISSCDISPQRLQHYHEITHFHSLRYYKWDFGGNWISVQNTLVYVTFRSRYEQSKQKGLALLREQRTLVGFGYTRLQRNYF